MLVEINLLPQKEQKNFTFIVIVSILAALFILATVFYFYEINSTKKTAASTENEIEQTNIMIADLQKQLGAASTGNSVNQLKTAIDWASKNRIETIPVMLHLSSLLPARGFIQSFSYQEGGAVTLSVQFDTPAEAAAFLDSLNNSSWITSVNLSSLNPVSVANSGTTSGSQPNASNTASNSGSTSTSTTVDSNTTNASTAGSAANNNTLPRYTGQFTLQFNLDAVKKALDLSKKNGATEEGVPGS